MFSIVSNNASKAVTAVNTILSSTAIFIPCKTRKMQRYKMIQQVGRTRRFTIFHSFVCATMIEVICDNLSSLAPSFPPRLASKMLRDACMSEAAVGSHSVKTISFFLLIDGAVIVGVVGQHRVARSLSLWLIQSDWNETQNQALLPPW
jgi:hypothetical protein